MDFRKIIKSRLKKNGWSVPKLAREIEASQQTLYNYLQGKSEMTAANLEKIFMTLGIEVS